MFLSLNFSNFRSLKIVGLVLTVANQIKAHTSNFRLKLSAKKIHSLLKRNRVELGTRAWRKIGSVATLKQKKVRTRELAVQSAKCKAIRKLSRGVATESGSKKWTRGSNEIEQN
jgi:hypothetical protein